MDSRFPGRTEFRQALDAAARELDATVREGPGEAWTVSGGTPACSNPNAAPWKAVASLAGDAWGLSPRPVSMPWNRRRAAEIAAARTRQLETLIRNARPAEPHEKHPFTAGPLVADRAESFAWIVAGGALAMALTLVVATLAGLPLLERELGRLSSRAEVLGRIGADPLPRQAELDGLGWVGRLAAAFLLAVPVAFFLGGLHAAVNAVGERFVGVARFAPWGLLFIAASSLLAFATRMAPPFAVLAAILMPGAAFLGTSLAWGRRRDSTLSAPRPKRGFQPILIAAGVAILALLVVLVPTPTSNESRIQETSRFRDRFLLGTSAGRALAHFYYAYTLYAAEPVRAVYSADPNLKDRQVKTALLIGNFGDDVVALRVLGFSIERVKDAAVAAPLIEKRQHDLYIVGQSLTHPYAILEKQGLLHRTIGQGAAPGAEKVRAVSAPATDEDWKKALNDVMRIGGLESMLLELTWLGWTAVFYAGPLFILLLVSVPVAAGLAWLTRRRSPQSARRVFIGVFGVSVLALVVIFAMKSGAMGRVAALKNLPAEDQKAIDLLAAGLKDQDAEVRYEAAFQSFMALKRTTFPKGGLTAELRAGTGDADVRVRLWCATALGLTRDISTRADILRAMDDPDMLVRYRAAEGLEHLDTRRQPVPTETIAKLREMMKTRSWYEGMYALDALRTIEPLKY